MSVDIFGADTVNDIFARVSTLIKQKKIFFKRKEKSSLKYHILRNVCLNVECKNVVL